MKKDDKKNMNKKVYIIEYKSRNSDITNRRVAVESLDDTQFYILEHHKMIKRLYKKWYKDLKWTPKRDKILTSVEVNKEYDSFTDQATLERVIPNKKYITRLWYEEPCMPGYSLSGYEDYEIFEIDKK